MKLFSCILVIALSCMVACKQAGPAENKLPILGEPVITNGDTVYPVIEAFSFINQDSLPVTNTTFENKLYVADFIFLNCPSICPKMNISMLEVYRVFEKYPDVLFLSHTIDPENDSIPRLKAYARNLNVRSSKWHFVTGNKDSIYYIAEKAYFSKAYKDSTAPGGFVHSGALLLIDKKKHIRGVYDGTNDTEKTRLIQDIHILLKEQL